MKYEFKCGCKFDKLDFDEINQECSETWDLINSGFTRGIFQLEGSLGKKYSKECSPRNIEELSDVISLIRPGCLGAKFREKEEKPGKFWSITDTYAEVKSGRLEPKYLDESLRPIFEPTCSVPIYQEQIMRICSDYAGFTLEEADKMRKAVGKKKEELIKSLEGKFVEGAIRCGHDKEGARTIFGWIKEFSGYGFNKCVSGDTTLNRGMVNQHSNGLYTVEHLYKLVNDYQYAKSCKKIPLRKKIRANGYGNCMAICSDGRIRPMPIKTIHFNGKKEMVKVTDNGGRVIKCTIDHKFMIPDGTMKAIGKIDIGGQIVCHIDSYDDEYTYDYSVHKDKVRGNESGLKDSIGRKNWAFIDGNWKAFEKVKEDNKEIDYCQICMMVPNRLEWHHINGSRTNNTEDNLIKLCVSCHKKEDYKLGRNKRFDKGHKTGIATIVNIEILTEMMDTYDVEMDTPEHNWIADGFAVSNSHGVSYAYIGYQTAYAKRHFPLEYFKAKLTHSEDKQDTKDEVKALVHEARLFDIKIVPPCLKLLNIDFAIQDKSTIAFGLTHIKGIGKTSVASLKRIAKFKDPQQMLLKSFLKKSKVKKNVMEALIKSGALDYLGMKRTDLLIRYKLLTGMTEREIGLLESHLEAADGNIIKAIRLTIRSTEKGKKMTAPRIKKTIDLIDQVMQLADANPISANIGYEKFYLGIPLTGNELQLYNNPRSELRCRDMHRLRDGSKGALAVIIEKVKIIKDKNKNEMCFMTVSDDTYMMETIVFSSTYKNYSWIIEEGKAVLILGKKDGESFIIRKIEHL